MGEPFLEERWIRWEPIKNLSANYSVVSITDNFEGFQVLLSDESNNGIQLKVSFDGFIHSYRKGGWDFRMEIFRKLIKKYGAEFCENWTFFKVENSKYIAWLSEQSGTVVMSLSPTHFSLIGNNSVVDIIVGWAEPKVEFLET